ncbi:DctP family TRAP transporter solute-binding subunit [Mediterraneibacter sp. NSJ-55]|uniref:DctP family TRAP transporter solute-binding subunit n=1 Tax=Mediterraneibacter hominis TaxID=2763054 RepID=A0A923LKG3_9FIRM|nr:DctP family TRAP transporter solute-binding subunit [Mediterraneibacter hominis]MBC5689601.1 DctP family TRAP transporter solute-binding subunit [Mediterraneibacter hominis]
MKKKAVGILVIAGMVIGLTACGSLSSSTGDSASSNAEKEKKSGNAEVLTLTFALSETSPHYEASLKFAELVEEYTEGAYTVEVYPNSTLAGGNQLGAIEMVQKGTISCGFLSPLVQCSIVPDLNALCMPYLWNDYETIDATLAPGTDVDTALNNILKDYGYIAVGYAENGYRELTNSIREVRKPEDLKDIKVRCIGSNMLFEFFQECGANPMDMNFSELFTGLQQGAVDGQENPISTAIYPQKYYEVQDYMTVWNYTYEPHPLMFNLDLWNSFDKDTQEAIQKAAVEACDFQRELSRTAIEEDTQAIEESGTKVTVLTEEEKEAFKEIAEPIVEKHKKDFNPELVQALEEATK